MHRLTLIQKINMEPDHHHHLCGLHRAVLDCRLRHIQLLIQLGADVNARSVDGLTPVLRCCLLKNERPAYAIFKFLVSQRADLSARDKVGRDLLTYAVLNDQLNIVRYLCAETEQEIQAKDRNGYTALHYACAHNKVASLKIVLEALRIRGYNVDVATPDGMTSLLCACYHGNKEAAEMMISIGKASVKTRDFVYHRDAAEWMQTAELARKSDERCFTIKKRNRNEDRFRLVSANQVLASKPRDAKTTNGHRYRSDSERMICHLLNIHGEQLTCFRKMFVPDCCTRGNARSWLMDDDDDGAGGGGGGTCGSPAHTDTSTGRQKFHLASDVVKTALVMSRTAPAMSRTAPAMSRTASLARGSVSAVWHSSQRADSITPSRAAKLFKRKSKSSISMIAETTVTE